MNAFIFSTHVGAELTFSWGRVDLLTRAELTSMGRIDLGRIDQFVGRVDMGAELTMIPRYHSLVNYYTTLVV